MTSAEVSGTDTAAVGKEDELSTGRNPVVESPPTSSTAPRRVVCTQVRGRPLPFLGEDQTVVGTVPYMPAPGRMLRVYSPEGVCLLQSSRIRLLTHGPECTLVITKNSTYRITFIDD